MRNNRVSKVYCGVPKPLFRCQGVGNRLAWRTYAMFPMFPYFHTPLDKWEKGCRKQPFAAHPTLLSLALCVYQRGTDRF